MATKAELEAQLSKLQDEYSEKLDSLRNRLQAANESWDQAQVEYRASKQPTNGEVLNKYNREKNSIISKQTQINTDIAATADKYEPMLAELQRQIDEAPSASAISNVSSVGSTTTDTSSSASSNTIDNSDTLFSGMLGDLAQAVAGSVAGSTGKASDLANGVASSIRNATSSIGNLDGLSSKISDAVKQAKDAAADSASSAANFASSIFGAKNADAAALTKAPNPDQGPKEPQTQISTLSPNSAEAIKEPITFKTGDLTSGRIAGNTKSDPDKEAEAPLTGKLAKTAKELSEKSGTSITSLGGAMKGVTDDLKSNLNNGAETLKSAIRTVQEPIRSTVNSINSAIGTGLSQVKGLVNPAIGAVNDVTVGLKGAIGNLSSALPSSLGNKLKNYGNNIVDNLITKRLNNSLGNVTGILSALNGVGNSRDILSIATALMSKKQGDYGTIADENGISLYNKYGNNTTANVDSIYTLAKTICASVNKSATYNYSYNKDLYDILMALGLKNGMSDLITQMKNCNGGSNAYFDDRTLRTLADMISEPASKGDAYTYRSVQNAVGARNITNQTEKLRTLGANLSGDDGKIASDNKTAYMQSIQSAGTTMRSIVSKSTNVSIAQTIRNASPVGEEGEEEEVEIDDTTPTNPTPAETQVTTTEIIDAAYVAMMVAGGSRELVEDVMSKDNVLATCMAYKLYGGYV